MMISNAAWERRRDKFRAWAKRSNEVQAAARMEREPDFETQRARALDDRRGKVVREGVSWIDGQETRWQVRHALKPGRTDQFDLLANGVLVWTRGKRRMPRRFRP